MAGGTRVLLIEDEPNIIAAIRFLLTRDGCAVTTHSNGADAVAVVRDRNPDVIVLDVMLPGYSGYDVLADLRRDRDLHDVPVLVLTARGQERERETAIRIGADGFMTKPFSNAELVAAVRALAAGRTRAAT